MSLSGGEGMVTRDTHTCTSVVAPLAPSTTVSWVSTKLRVTPNEGE